MYLFFIRHFNDIDHITPIVWKMSQDSLPVTVYCMNPAYDIQSDYRLNFLKENGIKVDYIYNDYDQTLGLSHKLIRFLFLKLYAIERFLSSHGRTQSHPIGIQLKKFTKEYGYRLYKSARKKFYTIHWVQ